jgi:hypothetical protein
MERHAHVRPVLLEHREDAPAQKRHPHLPCTPDAVRAEGLSVVFLATPPEVSMELAPAMLGAWSGPPEVAVTVILICVALTLANVSSLVRLSGITFPVTVLSVFQVPLPSLYSIV